MVALSSIQPQQCCTVFQVGLASLHVSQRAVSIIYGLFCRQLASGLARPQLVVLRAMAR